MRHWFGVLVQAGDETLKIKARIYQQTIVFHVPQEWGPLAHCHQFYSNLSSESRTKDGSFSILETQYSSGASPAPVEWDSHHKPAWFIYEGLSPYRWARLTDHTFLSANTAWGPYINRSSHPCIPTVQPLLTVLLCHVFKRKSGAWWTPLEADAALMGRDAWWGWDVLQAAHQ